MSDAPAKQSRQLPPQVAHGVLVISRDAEARQAIQTVALRQACEARAGSDAAFAATAIEAGICRVIFLASDIKDFGPDAARAQCRVTGRSSPHVVWLVTKGSGVFSVPVAAAAGADDLLMLPADEAEIGARLAQALRIVDMQAELDRRADRYAKLNGQYLAAAELLRMAATADHLTGLRNRRATLDSLASMWAQAIRHGSPLSVAILELDNLRLVNEAQGDSAGDAMLTTAATAISKSIRTEDVAGRYSSAEFLLLMPHTAAVEATACVARCRDAAKAVGLSLTAGVAQLCSDVASPQALIARAQAARDQAKRPANSRVICWGQTSAPKHATPSAA